LGASASTLAFWKFHVDWAAPANSTFSGPTTLAAASYAEACSGGTCIPQSGTTQKLDSLADRLMFRLAYRNFADHEALVVNHSVTAGSSTGVRWYEIRVANGAPSIFQQGTYAPDASYRWMGSIALDQSGNMGLGFSVSSSTLHPEIRYTGRLAGDTPGQMTQGEGTILAGAGSQTGSSLSRWGDYSMMGVDPTDDCTFWFTTEYIPANGAFNWKTRIGSFKFPGCGAQATNDFSISANPASLSLAAGGTGTSAIATAVVSGSAETVALSVGGAPNGATASISPASVTAGGSATLTVNAGSAAPGTYTLTVTGTSASATQSTGVTVTIQGAPDFTVSLSPSTRTVAAGGSTTYTATTAALNGSTQTISLSVSGLPADVTGSFSPASVTAGGSSTLTLTAASTAAAATATFTVTGTSGAVSRSATASVTVTTASGDTQLSNGVAVGNLSGAAGSQSFFYVSVPAGQASLTVQISGGTGDADLYVRLGSRPTLSAYNCRPYLNGNNETCTISSPAAGDWYVLLNGYAAYSGVTLKATYAADTTAALTNGVPVTGISGASGSTQFWKLTVPAAQAKVVFTISGGTGDADLYVRRGSRPTTTAYDCRPYITGNNETCTFTSPVAGDYYVMLRGYTAYSGVTLKGQYP
ncbi:MAG: pre-peptidase C-terminal domain-containing protein, partial [Myxococcales bacterium]